MYFIIFLHSSYCELLSNGFAPVDPLDFAVTDMKCLRLIATILRRAPSVLTSVGVRTEYINEYLRCNNYFLTIKVGGIILDQTGSGYWQSSELFYKQ